MKASAASFAENQLLFGRDETSSIVCAELAGDSQITIFRRLDDGLTTETHPFQPFLWLGEQVFLQGFDRKVEYVPLAGGGAFKSLARFQSWEDLQQARKFLGTTPHFAINDPVQQYLTSTGRTSFKALPFDQLHRLQLATATAADSTLRALQLCDNRGWQEELTGTEAQILKRFVETIQERDPDVIEGHDIFRGVLAQLTARARVARAPLKLGRDGSALRSRQSRVQIAERTIQYPKYEIHGRHVVDTFLLSVYYDVSSRELEGFDLAEVARHFGVPETGAVAVREAWRPAQPELFRSGANLSLQLPGCRCPRQCHKDRRALSARVFAAAPFGPAIRRTAPVRGRLYGRLP